MSGMEEWVQCESTAGASLVNGADFVDVDHDDRTATNGGVFRMASYICFAGAEKSHAINTVGGWVSGTRCLPVKG